VAQRKTLNETQVAVLRWIADGCPIGVMDGDSHRTSAVALRHRGPRDNLGAGHISMTTQPLSRVRKRGSPLVQSWAHLGSNQGPPACEAGALPLSYAPESESRIPNEIRSNLGEGRLIANVPVPGTGTKRMRKRHATQRSPLRCCIPGRVPVPGTGTQL
jgi:hypothetical protein